MNDTATEKLRGQGKFKRARIPIEAWSDAPELKKPEWFKVKLKSDDIERVRALKASFRERNLHTVCEEASCPNLIECFAKGTATFMILGDRCTRRCGFCDVAHGKPLPPNPNEAKDLAESIAAMHLRYIVLTSVDRDDLLDGGAGHFVACIQSIRERIPGIRIEILVPDFRGRRQRALDILAAAPCDVFNHNIETSPKLYHFARVGSDYQASLELLLEHKQRWPNTPTKSGLMVGLGETDEDVIEVLEDLKAHRVDRITIGQYLRPSVHHLPVRRYVHPEQFEYYKDVGMEMGFEHIASGPMVRSSYHADRQADGEDVG